LALGLYIEAGIEHSFEARDDVENTVENVYISACDTRQWGDDQLSDTETIAVGDTRRWRVEPGAMMSALA
jgi:hypothetical protein